MRRIQEWMEFGGMAILFAGAAYVGALACGNPTPPDPPTSPCPDGEVWTDAGCVPRFPTECGEGTELVDGECVPIAPTNNNPTNNNPTNNNPTNNSTVNNSNNTTLPPVEYRTKGTYRMSVGTQMWPDGDWVIIGDGEGIDSITIPEVDSTWNVMYWHIENFEFPTLPAKVDSVLVRGTVTDHYTEYPGESNSGDPMGVIGPPNSNCLAPNLAGSSLPGTTELGTDTAGYVTGQFFDPVRTGEEIIVFEVGDCPALNVNDDPIADFFTSENTTPTLTNDSIDIDGYEMRIRAFDDAEIAILNRTIWACSDQGYARQTCLGNGTLSAGNVLIATMSLATFPQPSDPSTSLRFGVAFQVDDDATNGKAAVGALDPLQGADRWFELVWDRSALTWSLVAQENIGQPVALETSSVRARIAGEQVTFIFSMDDFTQMPRYRFYSYGVDDAGNEAGDVSGNDPTAPFEAIP